MASREGAAGPSRRTRHRRRDHAGHDVAGRGGERAAASRERVAVLCRSAVERLEAAALAHDTTHATVRRVHLGTDVLTVHGSGWDLGRYVLWPDGSLREVADRIGWVDEDSGEVRLRSDARWCAGPVSVAPAPRGGVWAASVVVPHVDVDDVGARTEVVVADDGVSRWADHPHVPPQRRRRRAAPEAARPREQWPDLAEDLPARVTRRLGA